MVSLRAVLLWGETEWIWNSSVNLNTACQYFNKWIWMVLTSPETSIIVTEHVRNNYLLDEFIIVNWWSTLVFHWHRQFGLTLQHLSQLTRRIYFAQIQNVINIVPYYELLGGYMIVLQRFCDSLDQSSIVIRICIRIRCMKTDQIIKIKSIVLFLQFVNSPEGFRMFCFSAAPVRRLRKCAATITAFFR